MQRRGVEASNRGYRPRWGLGAEEACRLAEEGVGAFLSVSVSVSVSDWGAEVPAGRARIAAVRRGFCLM